MSKVQLQVNDILTGTLSKYEVKALVNHGAFGRVALCTSAATSQPTAVKVLKDHPQVNELFQREVNALEKIRDSELDRKNIVEFIEGFRYKGTYCLVFEPLDQTLHSFIRERRHTGFATVPYTDIGIITQQLLTALNTLRSLGLIHGDIKPDNVMIVNHKVRPIQVKLIDFGQAQFSTDDELNDEIQALCYRAPEVFLGLPITEAVDIWGLGCVMAFMLLKTHLFPLKCEYAAMKTIVRLQGQPEDSLLDAGLRAKHFFRKEGRNQVWRMNTPREYSNATGNRTKIVVCISSKFTCLEDLKMYSKDFSHAGLFLNLLKRMLHVNYLKRMTPSAALNDTFITVSCKAARKPQMRRNVVES